MTPRSDTNIELKFRPLEFSLNKYPELVKPLLEYFYIYFNDFTMSESLLRKWDPTGEHLPKMVETATREFLARLVYHNILYLSDKELEYFPGVIEEIGSSTEYSSLMPEWFFSLITIFQTVGDCMEEDLSEDVPVDLKRHWPKIIGNLLTTLFIPALKRGKEEAAERATRKKESVQ